MAPPRDVFEVSKPFEIQIRSQKQNFENVGPIGQFSCFETTIHGPEGCSGGLFYSVLGLVACQVGCQKIEASPHLKKFFGEELKSLGETY